MEAKGFCDHALENREGAESLDVGDGRDLGEFVADEILIFGGLGKVGKDACQGHGNGVTVECQ